MDLTIHRERVCHFCRHAIRRRREMTNSQPERKVPCEVYSRIVGYLRPVRNWNVGKKQEYAEREEYVVQARIIEAEKADAK
jgi:anaerobic ribonucleoside-triphosphate reductase